MFGVLRSQGFTSGEADGIPGDDFALGDILVAENATWAAGWQEGTFVQDAVSLARLTGNVFRTGLCGSKSASLPEP